MKKLLLSALSAVGFSLPVQAHAQDYNIPRMIELLEAGNPVGITDGEFGRAYIAGLALRLNAIATSNGCRTAEMEVLMSGALLDVYSYFSGGKLVTFSFDVPLSLEDLRKATGTAVDLGYFLTAGFDDATAFAAKDRCDTDAFQGVYRNAFRLMAARGIKPAEGHDLYRLTAYASPRFRQGLEATGIFGRYSWSGDFTQIDGIDVIASNNASVSNFVDFINPPEEYVPDWHVIDRPGMRIYRLFKQNIGSLIEVTYGIMRTAGITYYHLPGEQWSIVEEDIGAANAEMRQKGIRHPIVTCRYQYNIGVKGGAFRKFWHPFTPEAMDHERLRARLPDHPYLAIGAGREKCPVDAEEARAAP